jgi:preprotein translocase subunit SecB
MVTEFPGVTCTGEDAGAVISPPVFAVTYNTYCISVHLAQKALLPVDPEGMVLPGVVSPASVYHPLNVYPALVGFARVIVEDAMVYEAGLLALLVPPFNV